MTTCVASGGAYFHDGGTFNNCIVSGNTPGDTKNIEGTSSYTVRYTCSPGLSGSGNITNDPQFVNAAAGNYRLQLISPCVNWGNNTYAPGTNDLDGNARTVGGCIEQTNSFAVAFVCTNSRVYSLQFATNVVDGEWLMVDGATNVPGVGSSMSPTDTVDSIQRSYRVGVSLP